MSVAVQFSPIPRGRIHTLLRDYAELTKMRVTTLIVMTSWCGFYFGALKNGVSSLSWSLLHALLGIGLVSAGTAALNEVMEYEVDARMLRTANRPLPSGRMSLLHGTIAGVLLTVGGAFYLATAANALTGLLALATAFVYLAAYTPLKRIHPICTFVGALPGAMPGVLGWVAARGRLEWGALVMFAIVFCSRSCSSGSFRTFIPSHGCIGKTTLPGMSACSPLSRKTETALDAAFCCIPWD